MAKVFISHARSELWVAFLLSDASYARPHRLEIDRRRSLEPSFVDVRLRHHQLQTHTGAHRSAGRDPPPAAMPVSLASATPVSFIHANAPSRPTEWGINSLRTWPKYSMSLTFDLKSAP